MSGRVRRRRRALRGRLLRSRRHAGRFAAGHRSVVARRLCRASAGRRAARARHAARTSRCPGCCSGALPAGLDQATLTAVAATFTQHYDTEGWRLSRPYPGVAAVLGDLARAGVRQFVVTNKRARPTAAILAACGLAPLIERVYTLDSADPPFADKRAMAQAAQAACAVPGDRLLVVGDSSDDRRMAEACGAAFAAAAYGYGDAARGRRVRARRRRRAVVPARFVLDCGDPDRRAGRAGRPLDESADGRSRAPVRSVAPARRSSCIASASRSTTTVRASPATMWSPAAAAAPSTPTASRARAALDAYYVAASKYEYLERDGEPPASLTETHRDVVEGIL